jgi:hypothetical protein
VAAALFCHRTTMSSGLAGRGFIAGINAAIAHHETPFLGLGTRRATARNGLTAFAMRRPVGGFGSRRRRLLSRERLKSRTGFRTGWCFPLSHLQEAEFLKARWRRPMRALSYIIAVAFVLAGPSLAGPSDPDLPGVGTFSYCGSPIVAPAPRLMASVGQ